MPSSDRAGFPVSRALVNVVRATVKGRNGGMVSEGEHRAKPTHWARGREPETSNKGDAKQLPAKL